MTEETSPIHDFYPKEFELDMNGKKQDWEAVVKIPFIDQARLLRAMARKSFRCFLTDDSPGCPLDR
jgi:5'-3' exoribonuclease 1